MKFLALKDTQKKETVKFADEQKDQKEPWYM